MSKYLSLVNGGSGKLGEVVLQRNNVQRVRKREIKNPQTRGQQIARMIAATATRSYGAMKAIVDHSFYGIPYGGKSMNYFIKNAMRDVRAAAIAITADPEADTGFYFSPKDVNGIVPASFLISRGELLNGIKVDSFNTGGGDANLKPIFLLNGAQPQSGPALTPANFAAQGIHGGDQLTFCVVPVSGALAPTFLYARIILNEGIDETATAFTAEMFEEGSSSRIITKLTANPAPMYMTPQDIFGLNISGAFIACILSRKVDGEWQRSTERLSFQGYDDPLSGLHTYYEYAEALPTWLAGGTSLAESDRYLNEG